MAIREIVKTGTYGMVRTGKPTSPIETAKLVQTAPPSDLVMLTTGEYVPIADFSVLSEAEQAYLRKFGVAAFNEEQAKVSEQRAKRIEPYKVGEGYDVVAMVQAGHTPEALGKLGFSEAGITEAQEIVNAQDRPGEEVFAELQGKGDIPKEAIYMSYDKTTGEVTFTTPDTRSGAEIFRDMQATGQIEAGAVFQGFDKLTGDISYSVPDTRSGEEVFNDMVKSGQIPEGAKYVGYNKDTGEVEYSTELTSDDYRKLFFKQPSEIQQSYIFRQAPYLGKRDFYQLTDKEKEVVLRDFAQEYGYLGQVLTMSAQEQRQEAKNIIKHAAIGLIPVVGTVYNWNKMSTAWRAISIATDVLFILPILRAGIVAARAGKLVTRAAAIAKQELRLSKAASTKLTAACGKPVGKAYSAMIKAETRYLTQLAKIDTILTKGKIPSARAASRLVVLEQTLRKSATVFAESLYKSSRGTVFDSPEIAAKFRTWSIGTEMVSNAKNIIAGLKYSTASIKALTKAIVKAEKALAVAKAKYPMNTGKWAGLTFDLQRLKAQLYLAGAGDVNALYKKLLAARRAGRVAEAAKIQKKLVKALNSMTIEDIWGKQWGGKRVATVEAKPVIPTDITPLKGASGVGVFPAVIASRAITTLGRATIEVETTPAHFPKVVTTTAPKVVTVSTPEVIKAATSVGKVQGATMAEVKQATALAVNIATDALTKGMTVTDVKVSVQQALQTELKAATQTQLKTMTKVAVRTAQKIVTKTRVTTRKAMLLLSSGQVAEKKKRQRYPDGTVVWKMGELKRGGEWKIIPPPYNLTKPISSTKPPIGVSRLTGTPQQTLTFIGGKLPFKNVSFDLGITDGFIDVKNKKIEFTGHGLETNVGARMAGATKGISIPAISGVRFIGQRPKSRHFVPRRPKSRHLAKTVSIGR